MFDEPSSYLDVKQRLKASRMIRSMLKSDNYVVVVEHDLSILDYLSDFICCLYGTPGAYGVVTMPFSVREGINAFLAGFIPTENMRFRDEELTFKISQDTDTDKSDTGSKKKNQTEEEKKKEDIELMKRGTYRYPDIKKTLGPFSLSIESGQFQSSEILVMLG